jgi:GNAT superfamily N-acetyltransferase
MVNAEAGRAAWGEFVEPERLAVFEPPVPEWERSLADLDRARVALVAMYAEEVVGFVAGGASADADTDLEAGQVGALYTLPRVWGRGIGRLLLRRGLTELRRRGYREAVLWTEERNARPRRFYEQAGWQVDGGTRERAFLGAPIREVRYRIDLPEESTAGGDPR